ncbi:MAG: (S)-ureidoglycine aminohydrolase [Cyclobacteriaceae bacterium]|nr:(S)-ureidoglycine aminohydrolase [Cyclobacteriaceae bacterium]
MNSTAHTRTVVKRNFALIAPDGWVNSTLPGWSNSQIYVIINQAMGAEFCQLLSLMDQNSSGHFKSSALENFIYIMEGEGHLHQDGDKHKMGPGHFAFLPHSSEFELSSEKGMKVTIFQKEYQPLAGHQSPEIVRGDIAQVPSELYMDDSQLHMQTLLPDSLSFDMAVNIFTYDPGGNLPFVETHVMEHGLIYLSGQGIYRLDDQWLPVMKDDCIWMAPYCPQWFVAMGKEPAAYLYYKNINRHPIGQ